MDLVMCPNGHPNRPGRTQCVVCRAPIVAAAADDDRVPLVSGASSPPPPQPEKAATVSESSGGDGSPKSGSSGRGCLRWLLFLIIGLMVLAALLFAFFYPLRQSGGPSVPQEGVLLVEPTATAPATVSPAESEPTGTALPATATVASTDMPAQPSPTPENSATPLEPTATAEPETPDYSQPLEHGNLIVNGDFSERWVDTWLRQVSDNNGVQAVEAVEFADAPVDQGLRLTKTGTGTVRLQQTIAVPRRATELRFQGYLRLDGSLAEDGASEGRVALMLVYLDENGERLGYSVWIDDSQPRSALWGVSPLPEFGPQLSPRFVDGGEWQTIDIRLQEEFVNRLPGLDADRVKQVGINLLAMASDTCAPQECPVLMEVGDLQLLPVAME